MCHHLQRTDSQSMTPRTGDGHLSRPPRYLCSNWYSPKAVPRSIRELLPTSHRCRADALATRPPGLLAGHRSRLRKPRLWDSGSALDRLDPVLHPDEGFRLRHGSLSTRSHRVSGPSSTPLCVAATGLWRNRPEAPSRTGALSPRPDRSSGSTSLGARPRRASRRPSE